MYSALIGYIWYEAPEEEQNFSTLLEFINASETREDDEEFKNAVDELFEELEAENPEHFAVRQYRKYKLAAGKTAKSILISCGARLAPFDIQELREIMSYDEMELDMIGDQRTAMFVIISDTDDTFNFVVAIMYTQLFNLLCDKADDEHGGRLGVTLDELISDEDITDIQSKYGIWKFDRVKEREKIQMMQKRILDFIEIIGGIFLAISLLLRVQFDMKVPAWITIICILIVTVAFLFNFVLAKKLDRK